MHNLELLFEVTRIKINLMRKTEKKLESVPNQYDPLKWENGSFTCFSHWLTMLLCLPETFHVIEDYAGAYFPMQHMLFVYVNLVFKMKFLKKIHQSNSDWFTTHLLEKYASFLCQRFTFQFIFMLIGCFETEIWFHWIAICSHLTRNVHSYFVWIFYCRLGVLCTDTVIWFWNFALIPIFFNKKRKTRRIRCVNASTATVRRRARIQIVLDTLWEKCL